MTRVVLTLLDSVRLAGPIPMVPSPQLALQSREGFCCTDCNHHPMQVVAAVIFDGPRVLLTRRGPGRAHAGLWEFPGGKVEPGESHQAALAREIREELALEIRVSDLLAVASDGRIQLSAYRAEVISGTPQLHDHDQMEWMLPTQVALMPMPDLDHKVRTFL